VGINAFKVINATGLRKLQNGEVQNSYSSTVVMFTARRMICAGHVVRMGEIRNVYRISVGEPRHTKVTEELPCTVNTSLFLTLHCNLFSASVTSGIFLYDYKNYYSL
jgi:hypothetical protein